MNSHQSENATYCANGCGFFGTAATKNMCSKCYRDHHLKDEQSSTMRAAVKKSLSSSQSDEAVAVREAVEEQSATVRAAVDKSLSSPVVEKKKSVEPSAVVTAVEEVGSSRKAANRCGSCKKKVGLVGFNCKCGTTFCGSHRYPEEHKCTYDYKVAGKEAIAKANPLVVAEKLQRL